MLNNKYRISIILASLFCCFFCLYDSSTASTCSFNSIFKNKQIENPDDQYLLGELYYYGIIDEINYPEAANWYEKAAKKGHTKAQYALGFMLAGGQGVNKNQTEAAKWYEKAAEKDHEKAQLELANLYYKGDEIIRNYELAFKYYKKAADKGNPRAYFALGEIFENGHGVDKNYDDALMWYKKAAEKDELFKYLTKGKLIKNELRLRIMQKLSNLPIGFLIGLILALIGIYLTIKSKKEKLPSYALSGFNLVKNFKYNVDSLEMLHKGEKIENLTVTKAAFWNAGRETISNQDIVKNDPTRLAIKGKGEILDAKVLYANNSSNQFTLELNKEKNAIFINFDYVDKNDGIIMQILHTSLLPYGLELTGKIKGAGNSKKNIFPKKSVSFKSYIMSTLIYLLPTIVLPAIVISPLFSNPDSYLSFITDPEQRLFLILLSLFTVLSLSIIAIKTTIYFRNRLPKGFDLFKDEIE